MFFIFYYFGYEDRTLTRGKYEKAWKLKTLGKLRAVESTSVLLYNSSCKKEASWTYNMTTGTCKYHEL